MAQVKCILIVCLCFPVSWTYSIGGDTKPILYDETDPILQLSIQNFKPIISNANNAWIVEFYNSWCGHCVKFAPIWKDLARDVSAWKDVIQVAAVDCSVEANVPLCREYSVQAFPTIKFFKVKNHINDTGILRSGEKTEESIRQSMIDFIENQSDVQIPPHWPDLKPIKAQTLVQLWQNVSSNIQAQAIILEEKNSYLGREVILDLLKTEQQGLKVSRAVSNGQFFIQDMKLASTPVVIVIHPNMKWEQFSSSKIDRLTIVQYLKSVAQQLIRTTSQASYKENNEDEGLGAGDHPQEELQNEMNEFEFKLLAEKVHMRDLENALRYSLHQEIVLHSNIEGEPLNALKSFISILKKYFPGQEYVKKFLNHLWHWLKDKQSVTADALLSFMIRNETLNSYLPKMKPWHGCHGSKPQYRGYPCSLWQLFHTLTVSAYKEMPKNSPSDSKQVLKAMTGYIKYFFSCEQCSKHFQEMAKTLDKDVHDLSDSILWLWQAHNKVNARLHGDLTEDPKFPKMQFPPSEQCPECRLEREDSSQWDLHKVRNFLIQHYSNVVTDQENTPETQYGSSNRKSNFNSDFDSDMKNKEVKSRQLRGKEKHLGNSLLVLEKLPVKDEISSNRYHSVPSSWGFSAIDVSLCIMLYICSAVILLMVYFVFIVKRRLRKKMLYQKLGLMSA